MTWQWLVACAVIAIPFAILVDASVQNANVAEAMNIDEIEIEPPEVQLIVVTKDGGVRKSTATFQIQGVILNIIYLNCVYRHL